MIVLSSQSDVAAVIAKGLTWPFPSFQQVNDIAHFPTALGQQLRLVTVTCWLDAVREA